VALDHIHNGTVLPHKRLDLKHQFRRPGWHKPITSNISISLSLSSCVACGWVDKLGSRRPDVRRFNKCASVLACDILCSRSRLLANHAFYDRKRGCQLSVSQQLQQASAKPNLSASQPAPKQQKQEYRIYMSSGTDALSLQLATNKLKLPRMFLNSSAHRLRLCTLHL